MGPVQYGEDGSGLNLAPLQDLNALLETHAILHLVSASTFMSRSHSLVCYFINSITLKLSEGVYRSIQDGYVSAVHCAKISTSSLFASRLACRDCGSLDLAIVASFLPIDFWSKNIMSSS